MFVAKFAQTSGAPFTADKNGNYPFIGTVQAGHSRGSIINGTMFKREKLEEEMNNKMSDSEFIEKAKGIFEKDKQYKNEESVSLYYENEFGGLDFDKETFKVYGKGKKRSGPSSKNSPRIIIEEFERKLK